MSSPNKVGPVSAIEAELEKLQIEAKQLNDDYLRALAEFDNFRKRKERELTEFREFANEQLLQELIPVIDNFERAIRAAEPAGAETKSGMKADALCKGIRLIYAQLQEALTRFGFQQFSCVGEEFDPRRCEAVSFEEHDDKPENTVLAESAKGYLYKTKVLRPAMVIVAKSAQKDPKDEKDAKDSKGHKAQVPESRIPSPERNDIDSTGEA
jgi:molecular chaperone GrpE